MNNSKKQQEIDKANEHAYDHDYDSMWDQHYDAKFESAKNQPRNAYLEGDYNICNVPDPDPYDR